MAVRANVYEEFWGGWSTSKKVGPPASAAYTQSLDFRKEPGQLSVLPRPVREDNGICTDLVVNEVMAANGTIYAYGNTGKLYKRNTSGIWSLEGDTGTGYFGMDYRRDADSIYLAGAKSVSLYNPITGSGTPTLTPDKYNISASTYDNSFNAGFNVSAYQTSGTLTTLLPTTLLESAAKRFFQTDIEPLNKISLFVVARGTGSVTLTLHDGLNNVLGTATVAHADLVSNAWNDFVFTSAPNGQVRVYPAPNARTYHIHAVATAADTTIRSTVSNDLSTCDLQIWADRMVVTTNGLHPIQRFQQFECIGNANYVSVWEPIAETPTNTEWQRHRLAFPQEYEVCGLAQTNEFLIIALEKVSTDPDHTPQYGLLAFWDGTSPTYNYFLEIPEGSPQGLHTYKNVAYYITGGGWWAISSPVTQPVNFRNLPGQDTEFSGNVTDPITVHPYAATVRRGIHLTAYPCVTTNPNITFGVYSWGSVDKNYPDAFGYNYVLSTGSQNYTPSNNLEIGMVQSFGDLLHISWRDTTSGGFGVDVVHNASAPTAFATWESLISDTTSKSSYASKFKLGLFVEAYYDLPAGATITLKYKLDRETDWHESPAYSTANLWQGRPGYARFSVANDQNGRYHEAQIAIDIRCDDTVTTSPVVYQVGWIYDPLESESLI